jgi:exodeoxyribonuclease VII large subunit
MSEMILSVSALNNYVANLLFDDENLQFVMVQGEISNFKRYPSGHCYFSVKDEGSVLKCVIFAGFANKLKIVPQNGDLAVVAGSVEIYERNGEYQMKAINILPAGVGELQTKQTALKDKLQNLGMFDRKRPIPPFPKKIGVVTSVAGAAVRDIINVLERRYPICELLLFNSLVQGDGAGESIAKAIESANKTDCDVLIVGRGGGSKEDLSAFDTEKVAFAIYNSDIPIISAVGHETDFSIADMVADLRAPTPSAAAELCAPGLDTVLNIISRYEALLEAFSPSKQIEKYEIKLGDFQRQLQFFTERKIAVSESKIESFCEKSQNIIKNKIMIFENKLEKYAEKLQVLNPLQVLTRGFAVVYKDNEIITDIKKLKENDTVNLKLQNGNVIANIKEIYET